MKEKVRFRSNGFVGSRLPERSVLCRFLDAGGTEAFRPLGEPASKKRQGAKSREAGQRLGGERYGDFRLAQLPFFRTDF